MTTLALTVHYVYIYIYSGLFTAMTYVSDNVNSQ